jgi:glycosyltransferase involved in cell wall biosynthesis
MKQEEIVTSTPTKNITPPVLRGKKAAAVVFSYFPSDPRVARAAFALAEAGMEVDLFCLARPGQPSQETLAGVNVTRYALDKRRGSKLYYIYQYLVFLIASFGWVSKRSGYDLVHVHNMPDILVFSALIAKLRGARVVLDLHDPMPEVFVAKFGAGHPLVRLLRFFERLSIGFSDLVLTPNKAFERLFVTRNGTRRRIAVVMNAPSEKIFPLQPPALRAKNSPRPFVLMFHGTLVERHGLHLALEAIAQLKPEIPNLEFRLYGAATEYLTGTILPLIKQLGLQKQVQYVGEKSLDDIAVAIGKSDLGLIPNLKTTFTEINFPTRIFEYLACGKPVIVPTTEGIRDYFNDENMLFFESGNVESLKDRIRWVVASPEGSAVIVARGQEVYVQYEWLGQKAAFLKEVAALLTPA